LPGKPRSSQTFGEERELPLAGLEITHPGQERIAFFDDLEKVLVDLDRVAAGGDVAIDIDHPAIGREAELPFIGWGRFGITRSEIGGQSGTCSSKPGAQGHRQTPQTDADRTWPFPRRDTPVL
jgi:hypothetical protein